MAQTKLDAMINPEVMQDMISAELPNAIRFAPLANVFTDLQGRPGDTLTFPAWAYIGDAEDVAEGVAIDLDLMTTSEKTVTVKKAAKGVEITDEAVLSGLGDPIGEATGQLTMSIAAKIDTDLLAAADSAIQTAPAVVSVETLQAALDVFADEDDEKAVIIMNPKDAAKLRIDAAQAFQLGSEIGANAIVTGAYGNVLGVEIVRSNKVGEGEYFLLKAGALALVLKRNAQVESDRDIIKKTTVITADEHYAAYLYDPAKVVKAGAGT